MYLENWKMDSVSKIAAIWKLEELQIIFAQKSRNKKTVSAGESDLLTMYNFKTVSLDIRNLDRF